MGESKFLSSQEQFGGRNSLLVRVDTDSSIYGWGEAGQYGSPEPVAAYISSVLKPRLIGKNPEKIEVIWNKLYNFTRDFGRKGTAIEAISGIDIALWDILGKITNKPVYNLLGGSFRKKIYTYATGLYYRGENYLDLKECLKNIEKEASIFKEKGFTAVKMKIGLLKIEEDMERVRVTRDILGDDIYLMADANHAYNPITAIKMGNYLSEQDVYWFEEPVIPENIEGYKEVRNALDISIAGGECEYTRYGFNKLISNRAIDIAQPDICCAGGLTEVKKIHTLASTYGVQLMPHIWGSGIAVAAGLHLLASLPPYPYIYHPNNLINEPMLEYEQNPNPFRDELLINSLKPNKDGYIKVPEEPGLGVDVDMEVLNNYLVE